MVFNFTLFAWPWIICVKYSVDCYNCLISKKYTKVFCSNSWHIIFYFKISWYSHYSYCVREELRHIGLSVYRHISVWRCWDCFAYKIANEKSATLTKTFWIISTFRELFSMPSCYKIPIWHTIYILRKVLSAWRIQFSHLPYTTHHTNQLLFLV